MGGMTPVSASSIDMFLESSSYPIIGGIPWIMKNPDSVKVYWTHRKNEFIGFHQNQAAKISNELQTQTKMSSNTKKRLELLKIAHEFNALTLSEWLKDLTGAETGRFEAGVPSHQSMHIYRKNIFRDWGWVTDENRISAALVLKTFDISVGNGLKNLCVLGAGAGRLAMDLHNDLKSPLTVAVDFNPLLLAVAQQMARGNKLSFYDFNVAPVEMAQAAKIFELKSDLGVLSGFHLVCGDVTDLPFKGGVFSSVLTPWLIDILPFGFKLLAQRVNRILEVGGQWVNFGPLGFAHAQESMNLTRSEIVEQLAECGFSVDVETVSSMKYLSSADEVNSRNETVFLFRAKKVKDVAVDPYSYLPDWLIDTQKPIILSDQVKQHQQLLRFQADLFHSIDGRLSVNQMAQLFSSHYKMPIDTALAMVVSVLRQFIESQKRK